MLILMTFLLLIILISRITEHLTKIPSTLSLIVYAFIFSYFFPNIVDITHKEFDDILYLMLPIILLPDILNLSTKELKRFYKEIIYLAFIAVIFSIMIATFITPYILQSYQWSIGTLIALFSMLMATDAITVTSIMSKFKLPKRLKIYAESESLFNDVTALIIFYFIAIPLISGGEVTLIEINITLFEVLFLSITIGVIIATLGYLATKILKNPLDQFIILYLVVIISFLIAEDFHIAGILSIVTSVLTFKTFVTHKLNHPYHSSKDEEQEQSIIQELKNITAITKKEFKEYQKEAQFIGIFANGIVFIIISNIINIEALQKYYIEIFAIFILTTIIRFFAVFIMTKSMQLPFRWSYTLTFAGTKGALAIIMSHSLPDDYIYREMFIAIVIGVVLLSTFIYTIILMIHIQKSQDNYTKDMVKYDEKYRNHLSKDEIKNLINILEKDYITGAYNKSFFEDILSKEIHRAQRYKTELSVLKFKIVSKKYHISTIKIVSKIIEKKIRAHDYFGKFDDDEFIILTVNTSLSGAIVLAEKILKKTDKLEDIKLYFSITPVNDTDDIESIYDRVDDALQRALNKNGERVEIEI